MPDVIWQPQPKQLEWMSRPEYESLYGGAAGGGKSDAMVIEALRQVEIPYYKALILRKTYPELAELIDKTLSYYPRMCPRARYNASNHTWTFPSGARIVFGAMQHTRDRQKYQGRAYDFIGFDELTHFTYDEYSYLFPAPTQRAGDAGVHQGNGQSGWRGAFLGQTEVYHACAADDADLGDGRVDRPGRQ